MTRLLESHAEILHRLPTVRPLIIERRYLMDQPRSAAVEAALESNHKSLAERSLVGSRARVAHDEGVAGTEDEVVEKLLDAATALVTPRELKHIQRVNNRKERAREWSQNTTTFLAKPFQSSFYLFGILMPVHWLLMQAERCRAKYKRVPGPHGQAYATLRGERLDRRINPENARATKAARQTLQSGKDPATGSPATPQQGPTTGQPPATLDKTASSAETRADFPRHIADIDEHLPELQRRLEAARARARQARAEVAEVPTSQRKQFLVHQARFVGSKLSLAIRNGEIADAVPLIITVVDGLARPTNGRAVSDEARDEIQKAGRKFLESTEGAALVTELVGDNADENVRVHGAAAVLGDAGVELMFHHQCPTALRQRARSLKLSPQQARFLAHELRLELAAADSGRAGAHAVPNARPSSFGDLSGR